MRPWVAAGAAIALSLAACGGDDDSSDAVDDAAAADAGDSESEPAGDDAGDAGDDGGEAAGGGGGAGGGTLVLGAETIEFDSARCFLEEQDAAAGGGKILFVAQAFGTTADGEELVLDVSRYDADSQFTGDDIIVDIGDPFSDDSVSMSAKGDIGTVSVDGSRLSAGDLTFFNFDDGTEQPGSFDVNC